MPTNDERREAAARLRSLKFTFEDDLEDELSAFYDALECNPKQKRWETNPYWFLADLIEPEPERTCRLVTHKHPAGRAFERDLYCSECDTLLWDSCGDPFYSLSVEEQNYCYNCGAKVVKEWHE
jgi:hypothetical protein